MTVTTAARATRLFFLWCAIIVSLVVAFPVYQAIDTQGLVFYTNGIDEAAYLSYPYVRILDQWKGVCRYSNELVLALHEAGLSGGYINLLFDCVGTILLLFLFAITYFRCLGFNQANSYRCAVITFTASLLVTPFNPLVHFLVDLRSSSVLFPFTSLPLNAESLFLRSPEPQMSWVLLAIVCAAIGSKRSLAWTCLCLSPFLYTFVRVPLLFCALVWIAPKQLSLYVRFGLSFIALAVLSYVFSRYGVDPVLQRFSVDSHLPVVSLTAIVATGVWLCLRPRLPKYLSAAVITLVVSTWVAPNVQIASGVMVAPTKYDEYWGAGVVAILIALLVQCRARKPALWTGLFLTVYVLGLVDNFNFNLNVYRKLVSPREVLAVVRQTPERVASTDLLLSVYLDLVYARQEHTLFSFTRTYDLSSDQSYHEYQCARDVVSGLAPNESQLFKHQFAALDYGYAYRGVDEVITMRRRDLAESRSLVASHAFQCPHMEPIFIHRLGGS